MGKMIISDLALFRMEMSEQWNKECRLQGVRNPFKVKEDILKNSIVRESTTIKLPGSDKEIPCEKITTKADGWEKMPSDAEIENFIRKREAFVAHKVLTYRSWDDFIDTCHLYRRQDLIDNIMACKEHGQCTFFCAMYEDGYGCGCDHGIKPQIKF